MGKHSARKTRPVRVYEDLADLISELADAYKQDTAAFLDPLIRPLLEKKKVEAAAKYRERMEALLEKKRPPKSAD